MTLSIRISQRLGMIGFLSAIMAATMSASCDAVEIAASVEYQYIQTPNLPYNGQPGIGMRYMAAKPGSTLKYLVIKTIDGQSNYAALWTPNGKPFAETTLIISVHGGGNDFTQLPVRELGIELSPKGYGVLAINDRASGQARESVDNFYDISLDIDAALQVAKHMGFQKIVIHGQSLGTTNVLYYAATHWDAAIRGVVVSAAMANLPWDDHNQSGNSTAYQVRRRAAHEAMVSGHRAERLHVGADSTNNENSVAGMPVIPDSSAQFFLTYEDYLSAGADSTFWIHRVPHPLLILRSESDGVEAPINGPWLLSAARDEGALSSDVTYSVIADKHPASADGHVFANNSDQYVEAVRQWLISRSL